jgi:hypothetical protein
MGVVQGMFFILFHVKAQQEKRRARVGVGVRGERAGGGWRKSEFIRKERERKNGCEERLFYREHILQVIC